MDIKLGKSSKAPAAPDPITTANAQSAANKETAVSQAWLNNVNQYTPYGNLTYSQNGTGTDGTPRFQSNIDLTPASQKILDNQNQQDIGLGNIANGYVGKIQDTLNQNFGQNLPGIQSNVDYSQAGKLPTSAADFQSLADQSIAATRALQNPQFDRQQEQLNSQLVNQGVMPGSEAYKNSQSDFGQQRSAADLQAVQAGQQQANAAYTQALASHQQGASELSGNAALQNSANQQQLSQDSYLRQMPINEYNSLVSGQQVQAPNFSGSAGAGQMQAPNLAQLYQNQYQANANNASAANASANSTQSGLFGLGNLGLAAYAAFSDRRLKTAIKRIGKTKGGFNLYSYRYKGSNQMQIGVMAQQVEKVIPEAITEINGFKTVNYALVR